MRISKCFFGSAVLTCAALLGQGAAIAQPLHLDPGALSAVGKVDERFESYNVEMAEVIGGKFWKPYAHMTATAPAKGPLQVGRDPNLFEARPPVDLANHRLRAMAAALGPAYVRVSGSWANSVYFQDDAAPAMAKPPEGFNGVLTRSEWRGVVDFAKAVNAKLVTSFTVSSGVRDTSGTWTPMEAQPIIDYTRSIGGEIFAAELFNEPNLASFAGGPKGYDATAYARDSAAFQAFVAKSAPGLKIVGPGDAVTNNAPMKSAPTAEDLLATQPRPRFDFFSYHFYPAVSQRCAPATDAKVGANRAQALAEGWLERPDRALQAHRTVRDKYAPDAPIWITETAQAACGGSPWAATFIDTFRYLDQMGRLARQGASVVFHNTLAASEYGLIDSATLEPRPNYWAALLWRRLMGTVVLNAGPTHPGRHVYAHCLRDTPGAVSVLAINTGKEVATLNLTAPADVYALTAVSLKSGTLLLNGRPLTLGSDDSLPALQPERLKGTRVTLAPHSIDFIALPLAHNPNCT